MVFREYNLTEFLKIYRNNNMFGWGVLNVLLKFAFLLLNYNIILNLTKFTVNGHSYWFEIIIKIIKNNFW